MKNLQNIAFRPLQVSNPFDLGNFFDNWTALSESPAFASNVFSNTNLVVKEKGDQYVARVDLPGVLEKDLEISLEKNILCVKAERVHEVDVEEEGTHRHEAGRIKLSRSIQLPSEVDTEKVEAKLKDGVLTVLLPKAASVRPKKIKVKAN